MTGRGLGSGAARRAATPAGLLALLVVMSAVGGGCSTNILHGIDERAANETTAALERTGIGAEKLPEEAAGVAGASYTIRVARGDSGRALELLRTLGLPRPAPHGFAQTYGQPSLLPTASEEHARYLDALSGELERTLESADGVVSARVHLVLPDADPLALDDKPRTLARAAVLLKARAGRAGLAPNDVRKLIAGSVAGLDEAAVSVVTTVAAEPTEPVALASVGPLRVTPGTRPILLAALVIALAILALLATLLLLTARRLSILEASRASNERRGPATPVADLTSEGT